MPKQKEMPIGPDPDKVGESCDDQIAKIVSFFAISKTEMTRAQMDYIRGALRVVYYEGFDAGWRSFYDALPMSRSLPKPQ